MSTIRYIGYNRNNKPTAFPGCDVKQYVPKERWHVVVVQGNNVYLLYPNGSKSDPYIMSVEGVEEYIERGDWKEYKRRPDWIKEFTAFDNTFLIKTKLQELMNNYGISKETLYKVLRAL